MCTWQKSQIVHSSQIVGLYTQHNHLLKGVLNKIFSTSFLFTNQFPRDPEYLKCRKSDSLLK